MPSASKIASAAEMMLGARPLTLYRMPSSLGLMLRGPSTLPVIGHVSGGAPMQLAFDLFDKICDEHGTRP